MATAGRGPGAGPERAWAFPLPGAGDVTLTPEESHHLVKARRVREGEHVVLFDGEGGSVHGRLVTADARAAVVRVDGVHPDREPARALTLCVSLPEAGRADALVSALAELGVSVLRPLCCARTPPERTALASRRADRWLRLAREAAKVNGRSRLLRVEAPVAFAACLREGPPRPLLLEPDPDLPSLAARLPDRGPLPTLLVGPEGGFTDEERAAAGGAGVDAVRLGVAALRTGTAAVAAAAVALSR
jgi:16S rRNA (uracil1498-N3)-methyltransferase